MEWQRWIGDFGLPVPKSPDIESIIVAVVLIAGATVIGWLIGYSAGPYVTKRIEQRFDGDSGRVSKFATSLLQYGVIAIILLVVGNSVGLSPVARMLLALALGITIALLIFNIVKALRLGRVIALILSVAALILTSAATLGGMQPLIDSLDSVGFTVSKHRFSLLAVINSIVIIAMLFVVARAANHILVHLIGRASSLDVSQQVLVQKLAGLAVVAAAVLLGIDLLGIDLTALTVFSGAAGLAVGFGLQKTFGNLIAGLILLMDRSVKPGDVIVVGNTFGTISKIGVRAVSVVTRDGKEHLIPNEQLMVEPVENWSYSSRNVRVHIPVGVSYGCDLALAQKLMIEAASAGERVLADPKPSIWLTGFGDSSVDHEILVWIMDPELGVGNVRSDILNRVWHLFAANDIEIPFPQRDIHVRSFPAPEPAKGPAA